LPGWNHYSTCTCGWCVHDGRTRIDREQLIHRLRRTDALTFLGRHSANSISSCNLNPKAHCPVCRSPVFFYANQFGSRVYFDDLGPPWPKHPCTDNPRRGTESHAVLYGAPTRRKRGMTQELITAANTVSKRQHLVVVEFCVSIAAVRKRWWIAVWHRSPRLDQTCKLSPMPQ
jgi:hypothetical protein